MEGSAKRVGEIGLAIEIEDMKDELGVTSEMAIALCDAVLGGELPAALETIGFALMASDKFFWDADEDEVLAEVIPDWSAPEVNYPLTLENVKKFRAWPSPFLSSSFHVCGSTTPQCLIIPKIAAKWKNRTFHNFQTGRYRPASTIRK